MFSKNKDAFMAVLVIAGFAVGGILGHGGFFMSSGEYSGSQSASVSRALNSVQMEKVNAVRAQCMPGEVWIGGNCVPGTGPVATGTVSARTALPSGSTTLPAMKDTVTAVRLGNTITSNQQPVFQPSTALGYQACNGTSASAYELCMEICDDAGGDWITSSGENGVTQGCVSSLSASAAAGTVEVTSNQQPVFQPSTALGYQACNGTSASAYSLCMEVCDDAGGDWTTSQDINGNVTQGCTPNAVSSVGGVISTPITVFQPSTALGYQACNGTSASAYSLCMEVCDDAGGDWTTSQDINGNVTQGCTPNAVSSVGGVNPIGITPSVSTYTFEKQIRYGDVGVDVFNLQHLLARLGFYTEAIDGRFGPATAAATKAFQRSEVYEKKSKKLTTGRLVGNGTLADLDLVLKKLRTSN